MRIQTKHNELTEDKIDKYEHLLFEITSCFGLSVYESDCIVNKIKSQAIMKHNTIKGAIPLRIWLSKLMVRHCIKNISSRMFNQTASLNSNFSSFNISDYSKNINQLPLSLWTIDVLFNSVGFSEHDIARILDYPESRVRESLHKIKLIVKKVS